MENVNKIIYNSAILKYGSKVQIDKTEEECAELIVALKHLDRDPGGLDHAREELADVIIMTEQARIILGEKEVDQWKENKLKRLINRLEG